jgi:RNA polymerase sigma factor (sigma-70 family)
MKTTMKPTMNTTPVADLVAAAADGDATAWCELVDRYARLVWSVIQGYRLGTADAADVSQITWLRLAEHLSTLRDPERVGAWLATTAARESLRMLRQNRRQIPVEEMDLEAPDAGAPEPGTRLIVAERDAALWEAFADLPSKGQVLLRLLFADPAPSYDEISAATGMPIGSIGPTRGRYLAQLRSRLEHRSRDLVAADA